MMKYDYPKGGTSELIELSVDIDKRVKAFLKGCYPNGKIPMLKGWTRGVLEERGIDELLLDARSLNYSIRTGETVGKGIHLKRLL
jgi:hypothetical protein